MDSMYAFPCIQSSHACFENPETLICGQVIWIEISNVHALLFEGFAKHKLVMRSSHRWDHSTPYPNALPSMAWIRPALRRLVQTTAHISVATEWDYWYSRSVQTTN
jgi:hypothetical protein